MESLELRPINGLDDGVSSSENVDSILASLTSLQLLRCDVSCVIYTQPFLVSCCRNIKLTRYYAKRALILGGTSAYSAAAVMTEAGGAASTTDCHARADKPFSEFRLCTIDGWLLFVLLKYDENAPVLRQTPARASPGRESCSQVCASRFMRKVVLRACQQLRRVLLRHVGTPHPLPHCQAHARTATRL